MSQLDDQLRSLAVIDATLAGEPVAPEQAELAELALILAGERPRPRSAFAGALDERVGRRFATPPTGRSPRRVRRRWLFAPGAAFALAAGIGAAIVLPGGGSGTLPVVTTDAGAPHVRGAIVTQAPGAAGQSSPAGTTAAPASPIYPSAPGRQVIRSAQLVLSTRPRTMDGVAQQVFQVIAGQHGVVNSSNVTATGSASGYAQFGLTVPSANLEATMAQLSALRGAAVLSRTDTSQDVTAHLGGLGHRLATARALHAVLLRKLALATTTSAIDALRSQLRGTEAAIASDAAELSRLHRKVQYSQISVSIQATMAPGPVSSGGGFTLGRAAHDAGHVLVVVAGVALIALAVLVPVGLLIGVGLWLASAIRRRRREQALDLI